MWESLFGILDQTLPCLVLPLRQQAQWSENLLERPVPTKDATQLAQHLYNFTVGMKRDKSQKTLPGNQDMHNDAESQKFTGSFFDYCLVWSANSFEKIAPQRTLPLSGMIAPPVMVVGIWPTQVAARVLLIPRGNLVGSSWKRAFLFPDFQHCQNRIQCATIWKTT